MLDIGQRLLNKARPYLEQIGQNVADNVSGVQSVKAAPAPEKQGPPVSAAPAPVVQEPRGDTPSSPAPRTEIPPSPAQPAPNVQPPSAAGQSRQHGRFSAQLPEAARTSTAADRPHGVSEVDPGLTPAQDSEWRAAASDPGRSTDPRSAEYWQRDDMKMWAEANPELAKKTMARYGVSPETGGSTINASTMPFTEDGPKLDLPGVNPSAMVPQTTGEEPLSKAMFAAEARPDQWQGGEGRDLLVETDSSTKGQAMEEALRGVQRKAFADGYFNQPVNFSNPPIELNKNAGKSNDPRYSDDYLSAAAALNLDVDLSPQSAELIGAGVMNGAIGGRKETGRSRTRNNKLGFVDASQIPIQYTPIPSAAGQPAPNYSRFFQR